MFAHCHCLQQDFQTDKTVAALLRQLFSISEHFGGFRREAQLRHILRHGQTPQSRARRVFKRANIATGGAQNIARHILVALPLFTLQERSQKMHSFEPRVIAGQSQILRVIDKCFYAIGITVQIHTDLHHAVVSSMIWEAEGGIARPCLQELPPETSRQKQAKMPGGQIFSVFCFC